MSFCASPEKSGMLRFVVVTALVLAATQLAGCYYMQAIRGHYDIMNKRRPIAEIVSDSDAPDDLKGRLLIVQHARRFAVEQLMLADNDSYRSYADLGREYVVWNVFAAPEFSLEPKTWCFPVAGCVAYRGYFAEEAARKKARSLGEDGYDVAIGGVSAYSTLGRFDDPVLNTMMRWSDVQLVATMFHELAHQQLYVKGDTAFNESFATAVADIGIVRWLEERKEDAEIAGFRSNRELRRLVMALVDETRAALERLYASELDAEDKRARKLALLEDLSAKGTRMIEYSGADAANWLAGPLNNARLVSLGLYEGYQEAFERLYRDCHEQLDCFYAQSASLAGLEPAARSARLKELAD